VPGGPTEVGFAAFVGVKLVGYTVAGFKLRAAYQREGRVPIAFGVSRTLLGVAAGLAYGSAVPSVASGVGMLALYAGLLPVRLLEWLGIIAVFFDRRLGEPGRLLKYSLAGIAWSYVLDAVAILLALITPGAIWVC
jgi:hypothetical protein